MDNVQIDKRPFAQGTTRYAYKAMVSSGTFMGFRAGQQLVLKVIKPREFNRGIRISNEDIEAQELTVALCQKFNEVNPTNKQLFCRPGHVFNSPVDVMDDKGQKLILRGETVLVEQMIHGQHEKFNSNGGWSNSRYILPNYFSHWTYKVTGGKYLVCDLQGHRGTVGGPKYDGETNYYLFTDPAVLSNTPGGGTFGCVDLGRDGINDWFAAHECNELCRDGGFASFRPVPYQARQAERAVMGTRYVPSRQ